MLFDLSLNTTRTVIIENSHHDLRNVPSLDYDRAENTAKKIQSCRTPIKGGKKNSATPSELSCYTPWIAMPEPPSDVELVEFCPIVVGGGEASAVHSTILYSPKAWYISSPSGVSVDPSFSFSAIRWLYKWREIGLLVWKKWQNIYHTRLLKEMQRIDGDAL